MTHFRPDGPRVSAVSARSRRRRPAGPAGLAPETRDACYLRRWIVHQAALYEDLLRTVASAPHPSAARSSIS